MKIAEIRDPAIFQQLVQRLMVAESGPDFHLPDDSGGDRGNDGYNAVTGTLYAIYCPEKRETADYRRKAFSDLTKAAQLATEPGYSIRRWVFVTPTALRERLQAELREAAAAVGLTAGFLSDAHLEDLLRKHQHLRDEVPALEYPEVARQLDAIRAPLSPLRVMFTLESEVPDEDLARVFKTDPGYRRYSADQPLPKPPYGPPPGQTSCRVFQGDGFIDFSDNRIAAAGIMNLLGPAFPAIIRPVRHTVCRIPRSSLEAMISPNEPLCMQPEVVVEVFNGSRATGKAAVGFCSKMGNARETLRLSALDNVVFADCLTAAMSPMHGDPLNWSLYDLGGTTLRFSFTFFYVEGIAYLPEASWPRLHSLHLVAADRCVISVPDERLREQRSSRSARVRIAAGAVAPTIEVECSLAGNVVMEGLSRSAALG
ncbi:MAG: hypothetical protein JO097_01925 [Acidobacteriaceae bacterium]|nr:hypothetical protein [Acidobacteriaceae bacterium]MBV9154991.1 hypothetical protein [Acidobacteriaceae bacterium]MBV9764359.1 hypothetical protein [Acidobacteriaceae bacterium]